MEKIVALLCVFGLGICFSLLGSISVKLMPRLQIDRGRFGSLVSAFMLSCLIASLIVGPVVDKIGYKPVACFGFIMTALCIFLVARAGSYRMVLAPALLLGFGAMALNTAGNTLIPVVLFGGKNPAAASNLGNVFFGLGLFLTPLTVSLLFRKTTYEKAIFTLAVIALVPVVPAVLATYPASKAGFAAAGVSALLAEPAVLVAALALFCYISLEASFCNWIAPYAKEIIGRDFPGMDAESADATAQRMLSIFAIAMMAGRLIASQIHIITSYGDIIIALMAIAAGLVILAMSKTTAIWTSILVACGGLAFGPCFPTIVGITFAKFSPEIYGSVFGVIFAIGLLGAVITPKAIGNLAKGSSIQKSLKLLVPVCAILFVMALVLGRLGKRPQQPVTSNAPTPATAALEIELPEPVFVGTPQDIRVPNLEKPLGGPRPPFYAPVGTQNVALGKPVTSTDPEPIIGELKMITDGDKQAEEGSYVELGPFLQQITIDLGAEYDIYAVLLWHFHKQPRVYFDVVVQIADAPDFTSGVQTIFNNDADNSSGLGAGCDMNYVETAEGKLIDAKGIRSRYVCLYSNGNSSNELNHYIEVEVFGKAVK